MDAENTEAECPSKRFPLLHFARSETNGWETAAKAVGNVPGTNLQAVSPAQWAEETCNTEQAGADNTSFTLLLALGSEKPNDELNVFSP